MFGVAAEDDAVRKNYVKMVGGGGFHGVGSLHPKSSKAYSGTG